MFRAYQVAENEFGLIIEGPNAHRWVCKPDEGRGRATGFAKALDRAYLEGQLSITAELTTVLRRVQALIEEPNAMFVQQQLTALIAETQRSENRIKKVEDRGRQAHSENEIAPVATP